MTTTVAAGAFVPDQVVCFPGTWELFCALLDHQADDHGTHVSFDGELIELMSPNFPHDEYSEYISRLIYEVCREWGVRLASAGTTTIRNAGKMSGGQPDKSFHVVPRKTPDTQPVPDLVVEVDVTTPKTAQINKAQLYANLGVREFWRYRHHEQRFEAFALINNSYQRIDTSVILPGLPIDAIRHQLENVNLLGDDWETIQPWQRWLRENKRDGEDTRP